MISTGTPRPTATMAASRSGATLSAMTWPGSRPIAASRASRAFRALPPSPWSRPRWSGAARRPSRADIISRRLFSSALLDAPTFARAVRAHWGVENRLHWVMDVVFHDDLARLRTGHGPENMAIVKHMAMNPHGHEPRPTGHPNHQPQKPPQA